MDLIDFFRNNSAVGVAFSGGVDSSYLLYAGKKAGADVIAYYVESEFQPNFEREDAIRICRELGVVLKIVKLSVLSDPQIRGNGPLRCYYCKRRILSAVIREAERDGLPVVVDGTNASDNTDERPGMRAIREAGVRSPLQECGLTKEVIRRKSFEAGLFTWNKPAYACLATRIASGTEIDENALRITEKAESILSSMGFRDFRVRKNGNTAKIQLKEDQMEKAMLCRKEIITRLKPLYKSITLDMEARI